MQVKDMIAMLQEEDPDALLFVCNGEFCTNPRDPIKMACDDDPLLWEGGRTPGPYVKIEAGCPRLRAPIWKSDGKTLHIKGKVE